MQLGKWAGVALAVISFTVSAMPEAYARPGHGYRGGGGYRGFGLYSGYGYGFSDYGYRDRVVCYYSHRYHRRVCR